jgi:hypothetical protein
MISQQELDTAIKRWKLRKSGGEFQDPEATADLLRAVPPAYEAPAMDEYEVDDSLSVDAETPGPVDGGVPQYVPALSDSSLIELDPDVGDSDDRM